MAYCSVQDLEKYYLGKEFKCGDYLSSGKANDLIIADATIIDANLRTKYTLPIVNQDDLKLLQIINEGMTVGTIDDTFREKTEDGKFERGRNTRKEALDWLKQLREGTMLLNSAEGESVIKFNNLDSNGDEVVKRFKQSNIEPPVEESE